MSQELLQLILDYSAHDNQPLAYSLGHTGQHRPFILNGSLHQGLGHLTREQFPVWESPHIQWAQSLTVQISPPIYALSDKGLTQAGLSVEKQTMVVFVITTLYRKLTRRLTFFAILPFRGTIGWRESCSHSQPLEPSHLLEWETFPETLFCFFRWVNSFFSLN